MGGHRPIGGEVSVSARNEVRIHRVVCAVDSSHLVNPWVVTQIEGAIVYGLTAALYNAATVKNGRVELSDERVRSLPLREHGFTTA